VSQTAFSIPFSIGFLKIALAYANNDVVVFVNGSLAATDTSASIPACSRLDIGNTLGGDQLNDRIRAVAIYPTRLTNSELSALTTL